MRRNAEWISISDMMAGLMMVFLFIAVVFMQQINKEKEEISEVKESMDAIIDTFIDTKNKLNKALHREFDKDLLLWGAEITDANIVRFNEPRALFDSGQSVLKNKFKIILDDFFPRYVNILTSKNFVSDIIELRIEGHTSSHMDKKTQLVPKYMFNADLSQKRAFSVLDYVFTLNSVASERKWLISVLRANGLAFAKTIKKEGTDIEDYAKSRRVEFRVITNTESKLEAILEKSKSLKKQ